MVDCVGELGTLFTLRGGAIAGREVTFLGNFGRSCAPTRDCFCKLPEDVADLNGGVVVLVPMLARPTTLSRANAASDLLLLLVASPDEEAE